jgi:hypothetical protein
MIFQTRNGVVALGRLGARPPLHTQLNRLLISKFITPKSGVYVYQFLVITKGVERVAKDRQEKALVRLVGPSLGLWMRSIAKRLR